MINTALVHLQEPILAPVWTWLFVFILHIHISYTTIFHDMFENDIFENVDFFLQML